MKKSNGRRRTFFLFLKNGRTVQYLPHSFLRPHSIDFAHFFDDADERTKHVDEFPN